MTERTDEQRTYTRRALLFFAAQTGLAGVLAARMYQLQVLDAPEYEMLAVENRMNTRLLPPIRGEIFDRNGTPLAVNAQNYRIVIVREQARDVDETLDKLSQFIEITPRMRKRAQKEFATKNAFVPVLVAENLDWETFARVNVNAPALPGVVMDVGWTRQYPHAEVAAHVVGYVGPVSEKDREADTTGDPLLRVPDFKIGKNGIERMVEHELRGIAGSSRIEVNAVGRVIRELARDDGEPGADLTLTIDFDVQQYAMERMKGQSAAAVMMDVENGDILTLASAPGYDPNSFVFGISHKEWEALRADEYNPLTNKAVSGQYPPGSTFKMLVAIAALEAGAISPATAVHCGGHISLGSHDFHCWRRGGHGTVNLKDAIKYSCDIFFYEAARKIGIDRIAEMGQRMGIGVPFDINLPNVKPGLMPTQAWKVKNLKEPWQQGETLIAGIGQGYVLATPLQLAVMTARIANGRDAVMPRLIKAINGKDVPIPAPAPLNIDKRHLQIVRAGMEAVCNEERGTAFGARIADPANAMAGKTGTAQVRRISKAERQTRVRDNAELPWKFRDHALFVAYAPVKNPKYAISVIVEHGGGGSKVAAPIARDILMRALYKGPPPVHAYPPSMQQQIEQQRQEAEPEEEEVPLTEGDPT